MNNPDYISPELYDRRDVLWIMKKQLVDNARAELQRLETKKQCRPEVDVTDDLRCWSNSLIIRLAELHLVTIL